MTRTDSAFRCVPRALQFVALASLLTVAHAAQAQEYTQRLRSPATVRGFIGGESHDSYVIRGRKGQIITVQISWRREHSELGENHAEFFVGELPNFDGEGRVKFGRESNHGKRWRGRLPKTGNYYIYVMAHPTAHYTLKVTVR
jgi:hypothetical protein